MRFTALTKLTIGTMIISLLASSPSFITSVHADSEAIQRSFAALDSTELKANQTVSLNDVNIYPDGNTNRITFTLTFYNNTNQEIDFINYWVRLQSASGQSFGITLFPQDKEKNKVSPMSSESYSFYANIGKELTLQDLRFKLIQWDFNVDGYERTIGTMQISSDYSEVTAADQKRTIRVNRLEVESFVKSMKVAKRDKSNKITIDFLMKNMDKQVLKLPDLQFHLKTSNGLLYPLQATVLTKDALIQPVEEKSGVLKGSVPSEISIEGSQLVITKTETINNKEITLPLGYYELKPSKVAEADPTAESSFETKNGTYTAKVNHINRFPWEDKDILVVDMTISNKEKEILTVPNLSAYLKLDDAVKVEAKSIKMDKVIGLQPEQSMDIQLLAKIPYTYDIKKVTAVLQEIEDEEKKTVSDILEMNIPVEDTGLEVVSAGDSMTMNTVGHNASYSVKEIERFTNETYSYLVAQVEVSNLEKRQSDINKLVGNFKLSDGSTIPASISELKGKMVPNGKALLYFYSIISNEYDLKNSQLVIGQGVTGDKLSENEDKPDAYVRPVSFILPEENKKVLKPADQMKVGAYTFNFSKFKTQLDYTQNRISLNFDYEMKKNLLMTIDSTSHKIEIEMVDPIGHVKYSQTFDLEKGTSSLLPGKHTLKSSTVEENLILDINRLKKYTINVYHIFQNGTDESNSNRRLMATNDYEWFVTSD